MGMREGYYVSVWITVILFSYVDNISCAVTDVSIKGPPAISEGLSVTLTCTATCNNGTCDYSWLRSNSKIESSNSYSIPNVNRADAGTYVCKVIDLVDKAESTDSHTLTVHYGPDAVTLEPSTPEYTLNEAVDNLGPIVCNVDNCSPPENCSTVWKLPDDSQLATNTLTLPPVHRNNSGTFSCIGSNSETKITKKGQISVTINYGPDSVNFNDSTSKSVVEGSSYAVMCSCQTCEPGCSVVWKKDQSSGGLLKFDNLSRTDDGSYECSCTNTAVHSKTKSNTLDLNVQYPPDVSITWDKNTNTLKCNAAGNPNAYIFLPWRHNVGSKVVRPALSDVSVQQGSSSLTLKGASPYMETGSYMCSVSNNISDYRGNTIQTKEMQVTVSDGPVLLESQAEYNVSKGSSVTITIVLYAVPSVTPSNVIVKHTNDTIILEGIHKTVADTPVDIRFYNIKVNVDGMKLTIQIAEVKEEYFGNIIVEMQNGIGINSTTITLNPQGPPDTPSNISYTPDVNSVSFKLKPGFYNGANQTFYVEYSADRNATVWNNDTFVEAGFKKAPDYFKAATVHGLQAETAYYFRVKGVNMYGESEPTEILAVKTKEEPLNVAAIAGGAAAGAAVVVVVIVIIICVLKRRKGKPARKSTELIPVPNIFEFPSSDQAPIMARSPFTNVNTGATNSVVYENTFSVKPADVDTTASSPKEHIYGNTAINADAHQGSQYQYYNVTDNVNKAASSSELNRQESTEPHYSNYDNQNNQNGPLQTDNNKQNKDYTDDTVTSGEAPYLEMELGKDSATIEEPYLEMEVKPGSATTEEPYLEMEVKPCTATTEEPYLEMEMKPNGKDYINVEGYKKSKKKASGSAKYISMHAGVDRRESIPDYIAPPPPKMDEEDYMNIHMGRKS